MKFLESIDQWLYLEGDTNEKLEVKRNFFLFTLGVVPPVIGLTILTYILKVPVLQDYGWMLLSYYFMTLLAFGFLKKHEVIFYYFNSIIVMGLTFFTMAKQGGLLYSGGIEFSSLAIVIFAFIFNSKKLAVINTIFYMGGIIYIAVFHSARSFAPEMATGNNNLIFTTLNSLWISLYILLVIVLIFNKRTHEEKQKLLKLKQLDDAKSRLFTNITHEFRTPLTLISGITQNIENEVTNVGMKNNLKLIQNNATRLLRLVNQMMELSKAESGLLDIHYVCADIMSYLTYLTHSIKSLADKKQISIHFIKNQEITWMDLDLQKTEDIIINLLTNAIKFTPNAGNIYLIATSLENNGIFQLEIRDTGIGIPKEKLPLIFDRFYRLNENNQSITEGSGIGLTLVKEYVQSLNGSIEVDSIPGQGTTFTMKLPITTKYEKVNWADFLSKEDTVFADQIENTLNLSLPSHGSDMPERPSVLIVEDNKELAQLLQNLLAHKFVTDIAYDGEEGIQKAITSVPDLIVSDIMMPGKNGYELCSILKNDFRTNHIPIVLLTAMADPESKIAGYQKGADAYIYKPFNGKELVVRMQKLFETREKLKLKYSHALHTISDSGNNSQPKGLNERFLKEVSEQLEFHFKNENYGIFELCTSLNISRVQLHRKLTALTGMSTSHFINKFRVEKAASLLRNSRKSVSEISFEVGFSDPGYFTRIFHKIYGKTPLEFRSQ